MGATKEMYSQPWSELENSTFHNWPQWEGEKTIPEIAQRMIIEHKILAGDTLIGSSLGGIIACEIANQLKLKQVILIGSASQKEEINRFLQIIHPIADLAPLEFIRLLSGKVPMELAQMIHQNQAEVIRHSSKAIFQWRGQQSSVKITRIHGTKDLVIPLPTAVDYQIEAGHLIAMTHAKDCLEIVLKCLKI